LGTGADEKEYSDAVVAHCGVRNELVPHRAAGHDDPLMLPRLDQPNHRYSAAVRDRAAAQVIRGAGGRVLLTGAGGDSLVMGTMFFFADWLVAGELWKAAREMARRAALGRVSFWDLAYQNALLPVVPAALRRALTRRHEGSVPPWITPAARRRFRLAARTAQSLAYGGRVGRKYADAVVDSVGALPGAVPFGPLEDALDMRHPYLHRPLVELALRLSPEMCVRPHARKWILREAMRGILPEEVRTRVGKGAADGLNAWSMSHQLQHADRSLRDPILAQLGCIVPSTFRAAFDDARRGRGARDVSHDQVSDTLEVELWLQLRSGRWAAEAAHDDSAGQQHPGLS
jgi:asparagine synthase (glutamine-hydrolysing)